MCLETSSELMTFQHVVLILLEMNVSVLGVSSVLGFNGYYQFMLVPTLRFAPPPLNILLVRNTCQMFMCLSWDPSSLAPEILSLKPVLTAPYASS